MLRNNHFTRRPALGRIFLMVAAICMILGATSLSSRAAPADLPGLEPVLVVDGLTLPVHITHAGDGSGRLFIVERRGAIRIYLNSLRNTPFLDITDRVLSAGSEEGLLNVAFPPGYAQKGYFYVYYTNLNGDNQVSRFYLGSGMNTADPASEELILLLPHPTNSNHNGGQMAFGPDGYLYIGTGDGGGGGDPEDNAQDLSSLLGKILRIDVEMEPVLPPESPFRAYLPALNRGIPSAPLPAAYHIPTTNPFNGVPGARGEIWAYGLRNPWRFSFDRLSGDLYIGDVGQSEWEEINFQPGASPGGENYGWDIMEGLDCYNAATCDQSGKILPVFVYSHTEGCSVTGGFVYRGAAYPELEGAYFLADYCSGNIWGLTHSGAAWTSQQLPTLSQRITSFGEDEAGEVYLTDYFNGAIYQLAPAP